MHPERKKKQVFTSWIGGGERPQYAFFVAERIGS